MRDEPELLVPDAAAWRAWLAQHHDAVPGVWLVLGKKGGTVTTLSYAQALDEALCQGWIDGLTRSRDAATYLQRWTPRRARSQWSARNIEHVARLEREGRMREAGRAQVRAAQADGRWARAAGGRRPVELPDDLAAALAASPRAQQMFHVLTATNRFAVISQVTEAKRPETRARRIARLVQQLADGVTPLPQKQRPEGW
ncbi:YdeI/OmpD-associated family protein [Georgenia yuyongxinii]